MFKLAGQTQKVVQRQLTVTERFEGDMRGKRTLNSPFYGTKGGMKV